ncbi:MAG: terminase large subunit domain-containing protein [Chlamydiales bacterium]
MVWQKQGLKSGKKNEDEKKLKIPDKAYAKKFLDDWTRCRDRHPGQKEVLNSVFEERLQYIFYLAGRKGAKTTTGVDVAWGLANEAPNRVGYLCYPTIAQGIEVVWEERRLQTCDLKDDSMFDKYVEKVDDSRHIVRFANGSFVKLIGTWTEARGRGTQPDFVVFDEFQDCNPDYIEAMDANFAAKEHSQCIFMGTPPKKRNHFEEWWERVNSNPRGKCYKFTSYDNTKLPHLRDWLDNKKAELIRAGKEDVWLREYMAEFCYSSSDRVLPDAEFLEQEEIDQQSRLFSFTDRIPVLAISIHQTYFCAILAHFTKNKTIFVTDHLVIPQVWTTAFSDFYPLLGEKVKKLQDFCGKRIRNIVWDESNSFSDVIEGFTRCRKDVKWQDRGIPLLREMMIKNKIAFSREVADFGLECQNMLIEESEKDVQKNYPHVCTLSMMVNEYFSQEKIITPRLKPFDKYDAFREMGIPIPKKQKRSLFTFGF